MVTGVGRPCLVCGRTTYSGSRCEAHALQYGKRKRSCVTCGRLTWTNYCDEHQAEVDEQRRKEKQQWRHGYDAEFFRNRRKALARDKQRCVRCGKGVPDGVPVQVDHILALRDGGTNALDNLQTLCKPHHDAKTAATRRMRRDA